jgi:hypothetical protein
MHLRKSSFSLPLGFVCLSLLGACKCSTEVSQNVYAIEEREWVTYVFRGRSVKESLPNGRFSYTSDNTRLLAWRNGEWIPFAEPNAADVDQEYRYLQRPHFKQMAVVFDGARKQVLAFGGRPWRMGVSHKISVIHTAQNDANGHVIEENDSNNLYVYARDRWQLLPLNDGPRSRSFASMAFRSNRSDVILFGGIHLIETDGTGQAHYLNDTWRWNGSEWNQLSAKLAQLPIGRAGHSMVYDTKRNRLVLFGGFNENGNLGDTWEFVGEE